MTLKYRQKVIKMRDKNNSKDKMTRMNNFIGNSRQFIRPKIS